MKNELRSIFTETDEFLDFEKLGRDYEYIGKSDNKLRFVKKEDFTDSYDLNRQTVFIQDIPVDIDILLAPLIEFLNKNNKGLYTENCCSGHYINDSIWMKDKMDDIYILYERNGKYADPGYISFKKKYPKLKKALLKCGLPLITNNSDISDISEIDFGDKSYFLFIDE